MNNRIISFYSNRLIPEFQEYSAPRLDWRHFPNLILNLTEQIVQEQKLQPVIDEVWNHRQPEDYTGYNLKLGEFLRWWNHSRYYKHASVEKLIDDEIEAFINPLPDGAERAKPEKKPS